MTIYHAFVQQIEAWTVNDLLIAGADFSCYRKDNHSSNNNGIERPKDDEEESEKLSKSAALIATGAALILNMSFSAPFTIANKHLPTGDGGGNDLHHGTNSAQIFKDLVEFDAFSLTASSLAIFFLHGRRVPHVEDVALVLGGSFLYAAAEEILMVFAMGLSQVYPRKMAAHFVWFVIIVLNALCLAAVIQTLHLRGIAAHLRARYSRLGLIASLCSLLRCPPGGSAIPRWHIALYVALTASWVINTRYLFTSKSMSMYT